MNKINNISIILSFIGLWITSFFSGAFEIVFGFILIFSFGILHGSNDILLIETLSNSKTKHPFAKILITYLLIVLVAIFVFYYVPLVALILFIVFSAYHFGEQHWEHRNLDAPKWLLNIFYYVYGLFILFLLFVLNKIEVIDVVTSITTYNFSEELITYSFIAIAITFSLLITYLYLTSKSFKKLIFKELFYLLVFGILFKVSTLIWGFTIYFIFWHSIPSLFEQVSFIYGDYNKNTILKYCKNAIPYWLISLIGISIVYYIFKDQKIFYAIFFSFIAAVTFPHSIVITKMFKHKKTQPN
jgi:Brp/Blh family beta-carotene 15,15'-monooxygenase